MEAYPFMWAKNKHLGEWQCVAKPDFISQLAGRAKMALLGAQTGTMLAAGEACMVRGHVEGFGILDLIYRRRPSEITDSGGRPISIIEGFVLRHRDPGLVFSAEHFDTAQARLQPLYERFKAATEWTTEAALHGECIDLHTVTSATPFTVTETTSKVIPPAARIEAISKRIPPIGEATPSARPSVAGEGGWTGYIRNLWAHPTGRLAIVGSVVAAVAIGAYVIAENNRRARSKQQGLAI
jgi:hypothetical protein